MKRGIIARMQEWADERLRRLCGRITPEVRVIVVVTMLLFFGGLSLYMTVSSIYRIGKEDGRQSEQEHGRRLRLRNDSIINPFGNGKHGSAGEVGNEKISHESRAATGEAAQQPTYRGETEAPTQGNRQIG